MQRLRAPVSLVWVFCVLVGVLSFFDLALTLGAGNFSGHPLLLAGTIVAGLLPLLFAIPGALIISRHPRNVIGWLLIAPGLAQVLSDWINRYLVSFPSAPPMTPMIFLLMVVSGGSWVWLIFPVLLLPLLFPTGRPPSPRWGWVAYLGVGMIILFYLISIFADTITSEDVPWKYANPIAIFNAPDMMVVVQFWALLLIVLTVASLSAMLFRYRKGSLIERQQIKWLLFGFFIFALVYIPMAAANSQSETWVTNDLSDLLLMLAMLFIPTSVTIAILRFKLFDIDVIIRLTMVYAVVTALLVAVYVAGIVITQAAFRALTGQTSDVAVLVTTLAITVLFNPVRRQVQKGIDRRFYRQKYDAVQALAEFATAARGGSDLDALTGMLMETVSKTLQPTQVALYMKGASPAKEKEG